MVGSFILNSFRIRSCPDPEWFSGPGLKFQIRPDPYGTYYTFCKYIRRLSRRSTVCFHQNLIFRRIGICPSHKDDLESRSMTHPAWPCIRASWPCRGGWSGGTCAPSSADGTASTCNTKSTSISCHIRNLDILLRLGRKLRQVKHAINDNCKKCEKITCPVASNRWYYW